MQMVTLNLRQRLQLWADELRAVANDGLRWSADNPYHQQRFARIRRVAAELFAAQDLRDADTLEQRWSADLTHVAPYPGGDAAIFNAAGEILLIQRKDDQLWAMPGGLLEVGETPAQGTCREAWEETGVVVEALALIGVYDSRLCGSSSTAHLYQFVFLCRPCDPNPMPVVSDETLDVGWFSTDSLPPLSPGHTQRIPDAFRYWQGTLSQAVWM